MGRTPSHETTLTFRIDQDLKTRFTRIAEDQSMPVEEIMREFIRDFVNRHSRHQFEKDARRQAREAAKVAGNPSSDEAQVLDELSRALDELEDQ